MIHGKTVLAIIPARGGSKGLPRKNILPLCGKPLIAWTIHAAKKSRYIDRCIVSTDDLEIAGLAEAFDGDVPFIRPSVYAADDSASSDVILHAIDVLPEKYDLIVLLQPTSPLRSEVDIDGAIEYYFETRAESIVSVTEQNHPIEWSFSSNDMKIPLKNIIELNSGKRRQDYNKMYKLNGAIYMSGTNTYEKLKSFYSDNTAIYSMDTNNSVDIDTELDFKLAELLIKEKL